MGLRRRLLCRARAVFQSKPLGAAALLWDGGAPAPASLRCVEMVSAFARGMARRLRAFGELVRARLALAFLLAAGANEAICPPGPRQQEPPYPLGSPRWPGSGRDRFLQVH